MKKRLLCTILIMVMMFGATVPSYAEAWTSQGAQAVVDGMYAVRGMLDDIRLYIRTWSGLTHSGGNASITYDWEDFVREFIYLKDWLVPSTTHTSSDATLLDGIVVLTNYAMNHLPDISTISGYVGSWMQTNNSYLLSSRNYLEQLEMANTHHFFSYTEPWDYNDIVENANYWLFNEHSDLTGTKRIGDFRVPYVYTNGTIGNGNIFWQDGTPLGTIAFMLRTAMDNQVNSHYSFWNATLTDYTGQLGIWDSQGETLTQEGWSPTSAINGLYKYLAYTQRDVARLTYVLASDEEITAREKARDNQEAVLDNFVDPEGSGSVSASNFGDIASASDSFKDNMNTGVSASGIFDVFTGDHTSRWFSTEMANSINNVGSGSRSLKAATPQPTYDTPLLDAKMTELLGIFGGDD